MPQQENPIPKVFISSTVEDLRPYRDAAKEAAIRAKFYPEMQEYSPAAGKYPPLPACLEKVDACDVLVVIVAYRYGWIPDDQAPGERKSITWLECERARANGKEVLAFLVDPKPETLTEEYRIMQAFKEKKRVTDQLQAEVDEAVEKLKEFKAWLDRLGIRAEFTTPDDLKAKIVQSLFEWREKHAAQFPMETADADPRLYLEWLLKESASIDIRGLQVGTGKAHKFGIEELYIPLTTSSEPAQRKPSKDDRERLKVNRRIKLDQALQQKYVTIIGDPGSGKTTFLRRIAFVICRSLLHIEPDAAPKRLGLRANLLPVFIRLGDLADHIRHCCDQHDNDAPSTKRDPAWLIHYSTAKSRSNNWGLTHDFFVKKLKSGEVIFLLDGLDEAPDRLMRETISEIVAQMVKAYPNCPIVVTSRPQAYTEKAVLSEFHQVKIDPLDEPAMEDFLRRWSRALHFESDEKAAQHHQELMAALRSRPEIRRLARNPLMLTALAVVHWNERRLPEQRADLYESIITWLLRSREQRPGRLSSDKCSIILQHLALALQTHPQGRQVAVGRRWAAEAILSGFPQKNKAERFAAAEQFLSEEEVDSGIVIARGNQITFWHPTFQEFLAAKALGGKVESEQQKILIRPDILHRPEWREVLLLFGGVLHRQGVDKLNNFFHAVLELASRSQKLADEARWVGLIAAMLRDLAPFGYRLDDARYDDMLHRVLAIFDRDKAKHLPVSVRLEAADALGQAGDPRLDEDNWITIPAGSFLMGAQAADPKKPNYDEDADPDESPVHEVFLTEFRISKYPVTVAEYHRFMQEGGYEKQEFWQAGGWGKFEAPEDWEEQSTFPSRPVVGVSWYEAKAYACWAGAELPTEAQWERAARGKSSSYRKYPWGNQPPDGKIANSSRTNLGHASPVGMFPDDCTEEGVLDMGGNVSEWCRDWKDDEFDIPSIFYERSTSSVDPVNDETGKWGKIGDTEFRVVRGGAWSGGVEDVYRCAIRYRYRPDNRYLHLGFRVVRSAQS